MTRTLTIGSRVITDDSDCYVIAEIGHNHQGELAKARSLFQKAAECGVQACKLQKRDNRSLYTTAMYNKSYEHENSFGRTYGEHREFLEFGEAEYKDLQQFSASLGIDFFATAFDHASADFLARIGVPAFKIASGDLKNTPLLEHVARFGLPMIVSTGGGTMDDIARAYDTVMAINRQLCLLHCTATYPTQPEEMNLRVIATLRERFPDIVIGLSDHFNGISLSLIAYMLGARVIEKHFTLSHAWKGTDHALSLEPIGMQKMVRDLQRARVSLGSGDKRVLPAEESAMLKMGKKLVAARDLQAGHVLTAADIAIKSPGDGLPPYHFAEFLGRPLRKGVKFEDTLDFDLVDDRP